MNKTFEITMNVDEAPREILFRKPHPRGYDEYVYALKECARIVRDCPESIKRGT